MQLSHRLTLTLAALSVVQAVYYYPRLPARIASHFDGAGVANDWSSPAGFFAITFAVVALNLIMFILVPRLIVAGRVRVNVPHGEYWLAPERRRQTLTRIADFLGRFGVASLALAIAVVQLVMNANLAQAPLSSTLGWLLLAYFVYVAVSLARLFRQFRKPAGV